MIAALAEADALMTQASIARDRLVIRAPSAGRIEALPFEIGERPPRGAPIAILQVGTGPFARVYVPQAARAAIAASPSLEVYVEGYDAPFEGSVRFISSEAAFTPYFALTEHDRGRLSYLAEIDLRGEGVAALPTGLPVEIRVRANHDE